MKFDELKDCVEAVRDERLASRYRDLAIRKLSDDIPKTQALAVERVSWMLQRAEQAALTGELGMHWRLDPMEGSSICKHIFITTIVDLLSSHGLSVRFDPGATSQNLSISWAPKSLGNLGN